MNKVFKLCLVLIFLMGLIINQVLAVSYSLPYAADPIILDGKLDVGEWDDCQPVYLNYFELVANQWSGPEDASGKAYFKWDENFLYFAVEVTDDNQFSTPAPGSMWVYDSLQIAIDPLNDRSVGYSSDDYEYGFALGETGIMAYSWKHPKNSAAPNASLCIVYRDETKKTTTYEGAFAWEDLEPLEGQEGSIFGFTLLVNDNDGDGRKGWLEWTEGIGLTKNPSQFATMILERNDDSQKRTTVAPKVLITPSVSKNVIGNSPENSTLQGKLFIQRSSKTDEIQLFLSRQGNRLVRLPLQIESSNDTLFSIDFSWPQVGVNVGSGEYELGVLYNGEDVVTTRLQIKVMDTMAVSQQINLLRECYIKKLGELIEQLIANDIDPSYPRVTYRLAQDFINYAQDDIKNGKLERGLNVLAYLEKTLDSAISEAQDMLSGKINITLKTTPTYKTGPISIKDGAFYREEKPVIFTGVGHFAQVKKDIPILAEYGFNIVQIEEGPRNIVLENGYNERPVNELQAILRTAAEHNIAVNLLLSPHYFPSWAREKFGDEQEGTGFLKGINLFDPRVREVYERFLNYLIPKIANEPALHSFCLLNEPLYEGTSEMSQINFRKWLKEKYGDLGTLNYHWGTNYQNFDEIKMPLDHRAGRYDQAIFNQERFLEFVEWMAGIVKKHAPGVPVHVKTMVFIAWTPWNAPGRSSIRYGVDQVGFARVGEIAGNDDYILLPGREGFSQDWLQCSMDYDLQRSVTGAPIFNSENHLIRDNDGGRYYSSEHIRTALWQQAINGQGASTLWVWERNEHTDALKDNILTRPECVEAAGRTALDLNRLAEIIVEFPRAPREIALIYSRPSLLADADYAADTREVYQALSFLDLPLDFVADQDIDQGICNLTKYKALIFPSVESVTSRTIDELEKYLAAGGTIILTGSALKTDEWGNEKDFLTYLHSKAPEGSIIKREKTTSELYRYFFEPVLENLQVNRPLRIDIGLGKLPWGIVMRSITKNEKYYVFVVNYLNEAQTFSLKEKRKEISQATDLISGQTIEFPFTIEPLQPYLLEIDL